MRPGRAFTLGAVVMLLGVIVGAHAQAFRESPLATPDVALALAALLAVLALGAWPRP